LRIYIIYYKILSVTHLQIYFKKDDEIFQKVFGKKGDDGLTHLCFDCYQKCIFYGLEYGNICHLIVKAVQITQPKCDSSGRKTNSFGFKTQVFELSYNLDKRIKAV